MNKSLRIAFATVALLVAVGQHVLAQNTYYWFGAGATGGSGNWDEAANWRVTTPDAPATTPGTLTAIPLTAVVANTPPAEGDDVVFSFAPFTTGSSVVTIRTAAAAKNIVWTGAVNNPTFRINAVLTIAGSLTFIPNMSITATNTGSVAFTAAGQETITSAGKTFSMPINFNGPTNSTQSKWVLQDNMTVSRVTFTRGIVVAKPVGNNPDTRPTVFARIDDHPFPVPSPMFVFTAPPIVNGGSNESHVDGYVRVPNSSGTENFRAPVGDGTYYRPLQLTGLSGASAAFVIRYFRNISPLLVDPALPAGFAQRTPLNSISDKEYWYIGRIGGSANTKFIVDYNNPNPAVPANYYRIDKWRGITVSGLHDSNGWFDLNGTPNAPPNTTVKTESATNANTAWFTIGRRDATPLPVTLVSFSAQQLDNQVQLKWQSASEENTSHFDVERSADGQQFVPLLTRKAQGNSAALVSYNALDNSPLGGTSYYRLKMVDLDGTFAYSSMVSVNAEGTVLVRPYPNPSNGREVQFLALNGDKLVLQSVMDAFGKPVGYEASPVYGQGLYVNFYGALPAGFYVATLVTDDDKRERVRVKFVVQ